MGLFAELKQRNVFRVAVFYAVTAWLLLQVGDVLFGLMGLPDWTLRLVLGLLALGFPLVLILAWAYELTPEGVKREKDIDRAAPRITGQTGRKLDLATLAVGVIAIALVAWQQFGGTRPAGGNDAERGGVSAETAIAGSDANDHDSEVAGNSGSPPEDTGRPAIAVLPFVNLSSDDTSFTAGLHDDLLTRLARIPGLDVVSRTSVMEYAGSAKNARTIAGELGVSHLLEGGVQRAGERVRVNVKLVAAEADRQLWADTYDRELSVQNIFDLQSAIADRIADALRISLARPADQLVIRTTDSFAAYEAYLRGRIALDTSDYGMDSVTRAIGEFQEAVAHDPGFAAGWAGLAVALDYRYSFTGRRPQLLEPVRQALERAQALDPDLPEVAFAEALYYYHGHLDYDRAMAALERARESMAGQYQFVLIEAAIVRRKGDNDRAIELLERAVDLSPRTPGTYIDLSFSYQVAARYADARAVLDAMSRVSVTPAIVELQRAVLDINATGDPARMVDVQQRHSLDETQLRPPFLDVALSALFAAGERELIDRRLTDGRASGVIDPLAEALVRIRFLSDGAALEQLETLYEPLSRQLERLGPALPYAPLQAARALALMDRREEARQLLDQILVQPWVANDATYRTVLLRDIAIGYALAGDPQRALALLDQALGMFSGGMSLRGFLLDPALAALADHPDFQPILDRHGWTFPDRSRGVNLPGA